MRSSHGFRRVITVATFELVVRVAMSRPPRMKVPATPGILLTISSTLRGGGVGALRGSGVGKAHGDEEVPWSSSGRKPVGRWRNSDAGREPEAEQPEQRQRRLADQRATPAR